MPISTIKWINNEVRMIDQTKLPTEFVYIHCRTVESVWQAIKELKVRGAPAIGVAGAFGVLVAVNQFKGTSAEKFISHVTKACDYLATSRPTAVNLFYAIDRMRVVMKNNSTLSVDRLKKLLKQEAVAMYEEDRRVCRSMGDNGAKLIKNNNTVMTVCNAGALATVDYGTALGVMYSAQKKGTKFKVFACETRPLLQGARLTAWELAKAKIDTTVICDNMAATLMQKGKIDLIIAGADRIAANGDTANKIGTYNLAVLANYHHVPFYIAAPASTFDLTIKDGTMIPIEERKAEEVAGFRDVRTTPVGIKIFNPAFDVTPAKLITAIITEKGVISQPNKEKIKKVLNHGRK
ncbi:MAG: S-methyl-5-thioribose-1-phosphate isomerase [Candidatus Omnitrophica bacterium]|nr:S-methyl-5-thioribose-1-phosphate isomerase [Candidatus Omnitrophota bacterium]